MPQTTRRPVNPAGALLSAPVTPSNTVDFTGFRTRGLMVGGAGDVRLQTPVSGPVTFTAVPAGTVLPVAASRVLATGTTATAIVRFGG